MQLMSAQAALTCCRLLVRPAGMESLSLGASIGGLDAEGGPAGLADGEGEAADPLLAAAGEIDHCLVVNH
jgi:hypothetical protein